MKTNLSRRNVQTAQLLSSATWQMLLWKETTTRTKFIIRLGAILWIDKL